MPSEDPSVTLRRLIDGHKVTQAIRVAVELGLPDRIAAGTRDPAELAIASDADPPSLRRLLGALAAIGILTQDDTGLVGLTPVGDGLRSDAAEPLAGWARFCGSEDTARTWGELLHSVRTGESAYRHVHGMDAWEYRATHPESAALFDAAMTDLSRRTNRSLLEAYDFSRFGTVVDVGGGRGALLTALLAAHPHQHGVLFDLPHVVAGASSADGDRLRVVGGSFFDGVPSGGDAYLLRAILHDWPDEDCVRILEACRAAMGDSTRLLIIERDLADGLQEAALSDLNMLVGPGGRERTRAEYAALLARAGLRLVAALPSARGLHVFEAEVADGGDDRR
jgi:hypothetical protein